MIKKNATWIVATAMVFFTAGPLIAQSGILPQQQVQDQEGEPAPEEADSVVIVPIPIINVPAASNQTFTRLAEWSRQQLTDEEMDELMTEVDSFIAETTIFLGDSTITGLEGLSARELENQDNRLGVYLERLNTLESKLVTRSVNVETVMREMSHMKNRWELTRENAREEEIPASIEEQIERAIYGIDSVLILIRTDLEFLLDQQGRVSNMDLRLNIVKEHISERIKDLGGQLFVRSMPGLITSLSDLGEPGLVRNHIDQIFTSIRSDKDIFVNDFRGTIIFGILFFLAMLGLTTWYRVNYKKIIFMEKVEESEFHMILIRAPFLTSLFLTSMLIRLIYPELPHTFSALNLMILVLPTLVFVARMFHQHVRAWFGLLIAVYLLTFLYEFLFFPDILVRLLLLLLSVLAILFFLWILHSRPTVNAIKNKFVYRLLRAIVIGFVVMLVIAFVANMVGAFHLAEFFTIAPVEIFLLALAIFLTTKVAGTLIYLLLISQWLHKLNFIREDFQIIFRKTDRLLRIFLWLFFTVRALRILMVKDSIFEWGGGVLNNGWKIGEVNITPASILIFVFVIWLSVVITRMITTVLKKDVYERLNMARGVPNTINMLLRIALIAGGFFFAAAAAGMELTNLSIVLGAFSVGIGFGLQNIFNNMVSGLILAFERPIKVGDTVQVGELMGTVLTIGLRSSIVRSFDGAEVIVPNGNLISDQMINWTRSDSNRRMDIRVGVAYGTDPEKVLEILLEVAGSHQNVDHSVDPRAYFIGFGDSSLDFRLLAWTDVERRLPTESEIHVTINARLKEAGIEIPFPQRDLHIRSDATKQPLPEKKPAKNEKEDPSSREEKGSAKHEEKKPPANSGRKPAAGDSID